MDLKTKNKILFGICIVMFVVAVIINIGIVRTILTRG